MWEKEQKIDLEYNVISTAGLEHGENLEDAQSPTEVSNPDLFDKLNHRTHQWHTHCDALFEDACMYTEVLNPAHFENQRARHKVYNPRKVNAVIQSQKEEIESSSACITCGPTVKVASINDCVPSKQTGYIRRYLPPPLQVSISQALLRGLAEVRFVGNLMGLGHCIKLVVISFLMIMLNVQTRNNRDKLSNFDYG